MDAQCGIFELPGQAGPAAEQVKGRHRPIVAGTNLCPWLRPVFIRRGHGQQVPDRHLLYGLFSALDGVVREKVQHRLIDAFDEAFVERNSDQQGGNALCGRHDVYSIGTFVIVPGIMDERNAVFQRGNLADIFLCISYQAVEFLMIHIDTRFLGFIC